MLFRQLLNSFGTSKVSDVNQTSGDYPTSRSSCRHTGSTHHPLPDTSNHFALMVSSSGLHRASSEVVRTSDEFLWETESVQFV
jgi:hypothetical protein